ncbi:SDR family oxidoreductase [Azospirillum doebereinerae]|uniref:SDR family oxidoreductase n=1 Tax=Azospirillum doebereinerae TaxID=92933 RepID=A0A3S0V721_9PROT|nr:SDR family oxidoreductase [Azospirillum doebereinerae]MCG5242024.1 SDR family oxidoreductase [Azospirillum doebereinerae]RUQ73615.1 SDR family oxidoreductase [Azospirillum doebereinerae]
MSSPRLFVFGLGYTARVFAERARADGWRVAATCRSEEKRAALEAQGIEAFLFDRGRPLADAGAALDGTTHLLVSVPPDQKGDPVLDHHARHLADLRTLDWGGYLSTTGVYGDTKGEWVGEAAWLRPTGDRQKRRVEAERGWLGLYRQYGVPMHLFRLAGIYGPGRSALDSVRDGTAKRVDKPGQVFCRIHVDDIATTLLASVAKPTLGAVYNVADDLPGPSHEVVDYACRLLGVEPPPLVPFEQADLSPMAASFYADSRRVKNDRIKRQLGVTLAYPDYRAGLDAQFAAESAR